MTATLAPPRRRRVAVADDTPDFRRQKNTGTQGRRV